MKDKKKKTVTAIRRSCITGQIVWVCRASSQNAIQIAYHRACKREIAMVRDWAESVKNFNASIRRLLNACLAELPINAELSQAQKAGASQLQAIIKRGMPCYHEFYDHIMESRRRRKKVQEIHRQMREREATAKRK